MKKREIIFLKKISKYKYFTFSSPCALMFIGFLALFSCVENERIDSNKNEKVLEEETFVDLFPLKEILFSKEVVSNGKFEAIKKNDIKFKVSDKIQYFRRVNGEFLKKGDIIAILDNNILKNEVEKLDNIFKKSELLFEEYKINYGYDPENHSPDVIRNLRMTSGYLEALNVLEIHKLRYEQTILKAPYSGVIANVQFREGDFINSSDVLCTFMDQSSLRVNFFILEDELEFIRINQQVELQSFSNKNEKTMGSIIEINPTVNKNGLIKVTAIVDNTNKNYLHGMNTKVFIKQEIPNTLVVPKKAVVLRSSKNVVFTVENNLAVWNYVSVIDENKDSYAVISGLKKGDTLIISNNINLAHGTNVMTNTVKEID